MGMDTCLALQMSEEDKDICLALQRSMENADTDEEEDLHLATQQSAQDDDTDVNALNPHAAEFIPGRFWAVCGAAEHLKEKLDDLTRTRFEGYLRIAGGDCEAVAGQISKLE